MTELETLNFFTDQTLVADPYPYMEAMRSGCPVRREPHHNVMVVTGYDEALAVFGDAENFSSCTAVTGPFPGFLMPLEGRPEQEIAELIDKHRAELPFSDQVTVMDPPTHTAHRALLMGLITPKRLKENEEFMWNHNDKVLDPYLAGGSGEYIKGFAAPFTLAVIADLLGVPWRTAPNSPNGWTTARVASVAPTKGRCRTARWSTCTRSSPPTSRTVAANRGRTR